MCCNIYKKTSLLIFIFIVSLLFAGGNVFGKVEPVSTYCSDFPENIALIKEEVLKLNPRLGIFKWPSTEQIRRIEVKTNDMGLIKLIAREKIEKIIKPECIPSDICERFIPLKEYVNGCDALIARYKCRKYLVQMVITSSNARFIIRDENRSTQAKDAERTKLVREVMEGFFNDRDILLKANYGAVEKNGGLEGTFPKSARAKSEFMLQWHETLNWWTDGEIIYFSVCFSPGSAAGCVDQKDWFALALSQKKGLTRKKEPPTEETIGQEEKGKEKGSSDPNQKPG